jgi:hypothetical protein
MTNEWRVSRISMTTSVAQIIRYGVGFEQG